MTRPSDRHSWFAKLYFLQRVWEPLGMWRHRRAVAGGATGRTLEIGVGTGFSFPWYRIPSVVACDPNFGMLSLARARAETMQLHVAFVAAKAEALPFRDAAFDTVVSCLTFCTIQDRNGAAAQVRRVLAPMGTFRFVEHGVSDHPGLARVQRLLTPLSMRLMGGCRFDIDPPPPIDLERMQLVKLNRCSAGTVARGTARIRIEPHIDVVEPPFDGEAAGARQDVS